MRKCESWAVAVVYLLEKGSAHYKDITDYILEQDLTTLGEKGTTASQTIGAVLRKKVVNRQEVFILGRDGYYSLNNEDNVKDHEDVQYVYQCLKNNKKKLGNVELGAENKILREENQQLKAKLQSIKQLCEEA